MTLRPAPLALLMVLIAANVASAAPEPAARKHKETRLAPFPPEVRASAVISPDGRRIAYVQSVSGKQAAVVDGAEEAAYDRIEAVTFSPNSQWRAYAASAEGK